jgi:chromosome segregation ATPase
VEKKIKFILIGLIGILAISFFINLQTLSLKQKTERERDDLRKENALLAKKAEESLQEQRNLEDKVSSLNADLGRASSDREEIQRKYELLTKEREELIEQLKSLRSKRMPVPEGIAGPQIGDAYWGGILKAKTDLELKLEEIRNELKATRINNEQLQREKSTLELEVTSLSREKQDSKRQIEYNQKVIDSVSQELVREKNDKFQIQDTLKLVRNENSILTRQLKSLTNRKMSLERRLLELQGDKNSLERRLSEMETLLKDQIAKMDNLKEQLDNVSSGGNRELSGQAKTSVELPPIFVRPQPEISTQEVVIQEPAAEAAVAQEAVSSLVGKVLALNKENNFVIIDLGEDSGVKVGDTFQAYRQDRPIANLEVIQARKSISACDIKKETTPIKVGDTVK